MRSARLVTVCGIACLAVVGSPLVPASGTGRTLPCIPHDAVDGRCERWSSTHGGTEFDTVEAVVTSPNGSKVFVTGRTETPDGVRALAIGYDAATGDQLWAAAEGREGDDTDTAPSLAVSPNGKHLYMAGGACAVTTDGSSCDVLLAARDATTGAKLWSVFRDGEGHGLDSAQGVATSEDGSVVYIGGQTSSTKTNVDYLVAAFDTETGEELWSSTYDGPAHGLDRGAGLVMAGDSAVVTGRSAGSDDPQDIATVAFDTREDREGEIRWVARYDGPGGLDQATAIDVDARGERVVVAGESQRSGAIMDPIVVSYDASKGAQMWSARYDDAGVTGGKIFDVAISPDGESVAMTGFTGRSGAKGPSTLVYEGDTGERRWVANLNSGTNTSAEFSPDGRRLYATGTTYNERATMHRTLSYQVFTGQQLWSGLFDETAPPTSLSSTVIYPSGLVVSPDGTDVYVAGLLRPWLSEQDDALTLAYTA